MVWMRWNEPVQVSVRERKSCQKIPPTLTVSISNNCGGFGVDNCLLRSGPSPARYMRITKQHQVMLGTTWACKLPAPPPASPPQGRRN